MFHGERIPISIAFSIGLAEDRVLVCGIYMNHIPNLHMRHNFIYYLYKSFSISQHCASFFLITLKSICILLLLALFPYIDVLMGFKLQQCIDSYPPMRWNFESIFRNWWVTNVLILRFLFTTGSSLCLLVIYVSLLTGNFVQSLFHTLISPIRVELFWTDNKWDLILMSYWKENARYRSLHA